MRDLTPDRIVRLEPDAVVLLDQRRLPEEEIEMRCASASEVADAIRTLAIRGAPAIGVAAAYGLALAAHVAVALAAAQEVEHLEHAMRGRTVIGQATGILMERFDLAPERAFSVLSRMSQQKNVKLRAIADEIVTTRKLPTT